MASVVAGVDACSWVSRSDRVVVPLHLLEPPPRAEQVHLASPRGDEFKHTHSF